MMNFRYPKGLVRMLSGTVVLVSLLVTLVFLASCQSTESGEIQGSESNNAVQASETEAPVRESDSRYPVVYERIWENPVLELRKYSQGIPLYPDREDSPEMELSVAVVQAPEDPELNQLMAFYLYADQDPGEFMDDLIQNNIQEYRQQAGELAADYEVPASESSMLFWYSDVSLGLQLIQEDILVLSSAYSLYSGGAHGVGGVNYLVLDTEAGERLSLYDLIREEAKEELRVLVEEELRETYTNYLYEGENPEDIPQNPSLTDLGFFENQIYPSEDFYPSAEGIHLDWDQYEIAPYVMGGQEEVLEWEMIQDYLTVKGQMVYRLFLNL